MSTLASKRIAAERLGFDGRGPELRRAIWDVRGTTLLAIDYSDLDGSLRHVRFQSAQVAMFTPEEVIGDPGDGGATDLGQSDWLRSFHPQHLASCRHFRLLFYDQLLDIVCESVEFADGVFTPTI